MLLYSCGSKIRLGRQWQWYLPQEFRISQPHLNSSQHVIVDLCGMSAIYQIHNWEKYHNADARMSSRTSEICAHHTYECLLSPPVYTTTRVVQCIQLSKSRHDSVAGTPSRVKHPTCHQRCPYKLPHPWSAHHPTQAPPAQMQGKVTNTASQQTSDLPTARSTADWSYGTPSSI